MNTAGNIGHMGKALLRQKSRHLHAAATVVAQASNGLITVQVLQSHGHGVHRNREQLKPLRAHARGLNFPRLTYIQHHGGAVRRLRRDPVLQLRRLNLIDQAELLEVKAAGLCKAL